MQHLRYELGFEFLLLPIEHPPKNDNSGHGDAESDKPDNAADPVDGVAEDKGGKADHAGPSCSACGIEDEKGTPGIAIGAREKRSENPQDRDEATEEDDLAAMPGEEIAAEQ